MDARGYSQFVEELIVCIREANYKARQESERLKPVTIFVSLEADPTSEVVSQFQAHSFADNVILLRQIAISEQKRKTIGVRSTGPVPRPAGAGSRIRGRQSKYPLRISPGLDNYRRLSEGSPEPVRVTLQLINENPAETAYNQHLIARLNKQFGIKSLHMVSPAGRSSVPSWMSQLELAGSRFPM